MYMANGRRLLVEWHFVVQINPALVVGWLVGCCSAVSRIGIIRGGGLDKLLGRVLIVVCLRTVMFSRRGDVFAVNCGGRRKCLGWVIDSSRGSR